MKIVILAGGTGSINLQHGLYHYLDSNVEGVDIKILTNAYDNGLSTGAVRKVCGGKILGPSDVRKNQTTRLQLQDYNSPWNAFLDIRFTARATEAKNYCYTQIDKLEQTLREKKHPSTNQVSTIKDAVDYFFQAPLAMSIDYSDFSLANIIYAGLARGYGNSLRDAATQMAHMLGIKDNVILNSDESLFLGAITKSGIRVNDEGDIVSWGNTEDPFVDVFFTDANGNETFPELCDEAKEALYAADLIILSSGTQWSSLIPTYASKGFKEAIELSPAKVIMLMNQHPDKDSPGQSAEEILNVLVPKYFPSNRLDVIIGTDSHELMQQVGNAEDLVRSVNYPGLLKEEYVESSKKFDPKRIFLAIANTYFAEYLQSNYYVFDYDDTLVTRGNAWPSTTNLNIGLLKEAARKYRVAICTGNSVKAVNIKPNGYSLSPLSPEFIDVFADGGLNFYKFYDGFIDSLGGKNYEFIKCLNEGLQFGSDDCPSIQYISQFLMKHGISPSKIDLRGDVAISIKPVEDEYRPIVVKMLELLFDKNDYELDVKKTGRTTVEINRPGLSKEFAVEFILSQPNVKMITYVGDEFKNGNDKIVAQMAKDNDKIKCLSVDNPAKTAFFLTALSRK